MFYMFVDFVARYEINTKQGPVTLPLQMECLYYWGVVLLFLFDKASYGETLLYTAQIYMQEESLPIAT